MYIAVYIICITYTYLYPIIYNFLNNINNQYFFIKRFYLFTELGINFDHIYKKVNIQYLMYILNRNIGRLYNHNIIVIINILSTKILYKVDKI